MTASPTVLAARYVELGCGDDETVCRTRARSVSFEAVYGFCIRCQSLLQDSGWSKYHVIPLRTSNRRPWKIDFPRVVSIFHGRYVCHVSLTIYLLLHFVDHQLYFRVLPIRPPLWTLSRKTIPRLCRQSEAGLRRAEQ